MTHERGVLQRYALITSIGVQRSGFEVLLTDCLRNMITIVMNIRCRDMSLPPICHVFLSEVHAWDHDSGLERLLYLNLYRPRNSRNGNVIRM